MLELKTLLSIVLPILGVFLGYFIKSYIDKKQALLSEVSKERREHYQGFVDLIIDIFNNIKQGDTPNDHELVGKLFSFYKKYILYASPKVINSFSDYFQYLYSCNDGGVTMDTNIQFRKLSTIMKAMRADLGLSNKNLGRDGEKIFRALIKDFDTIIK
ncbi:hypothetical protein [Myroides sp. DF42-4-2]|uniref:hypothetical protein n=1 Tax=Myroides sp. DF42-4-2 TaxID=2746726 RepID=UPI0025763184|nr:hypothetical protein [Myroides sp. DF42-4-2]MDM1408688.1 hypothetical protein [Myroides sp. DF42-4-2]